MEKLREEHETRQEAQALVVAVAAPVLAAVHRDLALAVAVAAIAQEVFHLEETLLASLPPVAMLLAFCPPVGGARGCGVMARRRSSSAVAAMTTPITITSPSVAWGGSWAAHDLHLQVATKLLVAAALQKLTQLLHVEVGLPEQDVLGLHRDWPGLCLLAHKRTGKRMMTLQTNHSTVEGDQRKFGTA